MPFSPCCSDNTTGSNHKHAILRFLIAALLALSPQKFHSMNTSAAPFENHSTILSMFVITTLVYAVAWAIETKLGTINSSYHLLMSNISLLLGTLATVLLVLVHVPGLGTVLAIKPLKSCSYSAFKITYKGILTKAYTATSKFLTLLTKEETNLYEAAQSSMAAFNKCRMGGLWHKRASVLGKKRKPTE
ncbi:hypothetical protein SCA6_000148 [Theobroma cacao]